jgi:alkylation response protein AidB-like acyl-CoA dehydrogenase
MAFFNRSRMMVAAAGVGLAQGAMEQAIRYSKTRKLFGRRLGDFQANRFKIAEMGTWIEAARNLTYRASTMVDNKVVRHEMIAMAKWYSAHIAVKTVDEALQMHGGNGYLGDFDISRFYRDAKVLEVYEGTKEIEKEIIAKKLLKQSFL